MKEARIKVWWPVWMIFKLVVIVMRWLCGGKIVEYGRENVPEEGPGFLFANHFTRAGEGVIIHLVRHFTMIYKKELGQIRGNPKPYFGLVTRIFFRGSGYFPTDRGAQGSDQLAIARTHYAVNHGWLVLIMPERTHERARIALREGKTRGAALIAIKTGVPVIAVAVHGTPDAISDGIKSLFFWMKDRPSRHDLYVAYSPQLRARDLGFNLENDPTGERFLQAIMVRIAAMLPFYERGFYALDAYNFLQFGTDPDVSYYRDLQTSLDQWG